MNENFENTIEDEYTGVDFDEDESVKEELKSAEFADFIPSAIKLEELKNEKISKFYNEDDKLLAEKIIEKKSGKIIEIKYNECGKKRSVTEKNRDKKITKSTDYYENGIVKMSTEYGLDGKSYKSMMYNVDGSRQSYVDKHPDGTADAVYYDVDGNGSKLVVKLDANKEPIEKHIEK